MRHSVVTPSFQNAAWLKLCAASIADQGVEVEHIVQDACSTDGTQDWLRSQPRIRFFIEQDRGMYDAINRGMARASGDILSYLNCDEQYLPGALKAVDEHFMANPKLDVVFADFIVVNSQGEYLFHRKVQTPLLNHLRISHLPAYSCAMFFRRRLITEEKVLFDPDLRTVGDGDWVLRLLEKGIRMGTLPRFTSAFTMHEENLGNSPTALREAREMHAKAPGWVRATKPIWILQHRIRKWLLGACRQEPFRFSLYTHKGENRVERAVHNPTWRWQS
jgi:glycosyltransferase involved in cell wall biosynthesis